MHGVRDVDWLVAAQQVRAVALLVHVDHSQAPSHRRIMIFLYIHDSNSKRLIQYD